MEKIVVLITVISTVFVAFGQALWKIASNSEKSSNTLSIFLNKFFIYGAIIYIVALIIWITLLSMADLSYLHPISSLRFIFAILFAKYLLKERVSKTRMFSVMLIFIGVLITI